VIEVHNLELPASCAKNSSLVENVRRVNIYASQLYETAFPALVSDFSNLREFYMQGRIGGNFDFDAWPSLRTFVFGSYDSDSPHLRRDCVVSGTLSKNCGILEFLGCRLSGNFWSVVNNSELTVLGLLGSVVSFPNDSVNLPLLWQLDMGMNSMQVHTIPTWLLQLPSLYMLQAPNCSFSGFEGSLESAADRTNVINFVDFSHNLFDALPNWIMRNVAELRLRHNFLTDLSLLSNSDGRLRLLDVSFNNLSNVECPDSGDDARVSLDYLNVDGNYDLDIALLSPDANAFQSTVLSARDLKGSLISGAFQLSPPTVTHEGFFSCPSISSLGRTSDNNAQDPYITYTFPAPWTVTPAAFDFAGCACLFGYTGEPPHCAACLGTPHVQCNATNVTGDLGFFVAGSARGGFGAQECHCFEHDNVTFDCVKSACLDNGQNFSQIWSSPNDSTDAACEPGYAGRLCSRCVCNSEECYFATHSNECVLCDVGGSFSQSSNLRNGIAVTVILIAFVIADDWWAKWLFGVLFVAVTALSSVEVVNGAVPLGVSVAWLLVKFLGRTRKAESLRDVGINADDNDAVPAPAVEIEPLLSFGGSLELLIFVFQVLLVLFDGLWPHSEWLTLYERTYAAAKAMFNVHPSGLPCTFGPSLTRLHVFLLVMAVPIVTSAVVALLSVVRRFAAGLRLALWRRCRGRAVKAGEPLPWRQSLAGAILFMFGFMYFELVGTITSTYACQKDPVIERWFMSELPWHVCEMTDTSYSTLVYVSLPFLFVYVVGYPLTLSWLLRRKRPTFEDNATRAMLGPFYEDFTADWQVSGNLVNIARRLCLSLALSVLPEGHPLRATLFNTVLLCYVALLSRTKLHRIVGDDRLDLISCAALLFVGSILLEPSATDKSYFMLAYAQTYLVAVVVSVTLALILVGALAFSSLSPAVQRRMWAACRFR
jgi:hypothetical protein